MKAVNIKAVTSVIFYLYILTLIAGCTASKQSPELIAKGIQARLDLAKSYLTQDKPRRGLKELLIIQDKVNNNPEFYFLLGLTYSELGSLNKALKSFKRVIEIDPDNGKAWNNMGQTYYQLGQLEDAKQAFKKALSIQTYLTPEYPAYNLSRIYKRKKQYDQAIVFVKKAVNLNKNYIPAYILLSDLYIRENKVAKAEEWIQKGVTDNPGQIRLIFILAENQLRLGKTANAIANFKHIIGLKPESEFAQMAEDYLEILSP